MSYNVISATMLEILTVSRSTHDARDENDREPTEEQGAPKFGCRESGSRERDRDREPDGDRERKEAILDEKAHELDGDPAQRLHAFAAGVCVRAETVPRAIANATAAAAA